MSDERTKTGIQEIDKSLKGGFPQGNIVLISGGAGTGKSTLCMQFLVNGATLFGEKGLYVSTEQNRDELLKAASQYGWNIEGLEQRNLLKIVYFDITGKDGFLKQMSEAIQSFQPKRLVVDSLTTLTDSLLVNGFTDDNGFSLIQIEDSVSPIPKTEQIVQKNLLYNLFKQIKKFKVTTILTTELPEDQKTLSADGVSEFIADGVVLLHYVGVGSSDFRTMSVRKMRYSDHDKSILPYVLGPKGIEIKQQEF
jgi:circadian clock protein KaiC